MTPIDIKAHIETETQLNVNVFVNYDNEYARYLVLTTNGAKHYMNVPLTQEFDWLLRQYTHSLANEIYRANKIIETQRKMDKAHRDITALTKTNDAALKAAKEVLNA